MMMTMIIMIMVSTLCPKYQKASFLVVSRVRLSGTKVVSVTQPKTSGWNDESLCVPSDHNITLT